MYWFEISDKVQYGNRSVKEGAMETLKCMPIYEATYLGGSEMKIIYSVLLITILSLGYRNTLHSWLREGTCKI